MGVARDPWVKFPEKEFVPMDLAPHFFLYPTHGHALIFSHMEAGYLNVFILSNIENTQY